MHEFLDTPPRERLEDDRPRPIAILDFVQRNIASNEDCRWPALTELHEPKPGRPFAPTPADMDARRQFFDAHSEWVRSLPRPCAAVNGDNIRAWYRPPDHPDAELNPVNWIPRRGRAVEERPSTVASGRVDEAPRLRVGFRPRCVAAVKQASGIAFFVIAVLALAASFADQARSNLSATWCTLVGTLFRTCWRKGRPWMNSRLQPSEGTFVYLLGVVIVATCPSRFWLGLGLAIVPLIASVATRTFVDVRRQP